MDIMTHDEVIASLMKWLRYRKQSKNSVILPKYRFGGYECDCLELTQDGFAIDYEVKTIKERSVSDLRKKKHSDKLKCNYMVYVVSKWDKTKDRIPDVFGIIEYDSYLGCFEVIRKPTILNSEVQEIDYKNICVQLSRQMASQFASFQIVKQMNSKLTESVNFFK